MDGCMGSAMMVASVHDSGSVAGCRSELANADAEQADDKEDEFVKGFKVANFEIIDSPDKGMRHHPVYPRCSGSAAPFSYMHFFGCPPEIPGTIAVRSFKVVKQCKPRMRGECARYSKQNLVHAVGQKHHEVSHRFLPCPTLHLRSMLSPQMT